MLWNSKYLPSVRIIFRRTINCASIILYKIDYTDAILNEGINYVNFLYFSYQDVFWKTYYILIMF